jgi:ATP:corrinoid adenosyltransferase
MFTGFLILKVLYKRKKEIMLLRHYEEIIQPDNVYELEDYRNRYNQIMIDDELNHRLRYKLVWSEELQKYIKTPRSTKD